MCMPKQVCGGQRKTCGSLFSPFTLWVLAIKLRSACLAGSTFTHLAITPALLLAFSSSLEYISGIKSCNIMPPPVHQPMHIVVSPIHEIRTRITEAILNYFSVRTQNKMKLSLDMCQGSIAIISASQAPYSPPLPIPCLAEFLSVCMLSYFIELYHCRALKNCMERGGVSVQLNQRIKKYVP